MSRKLHSLRKERRRAALSQADVCALLGAGWKSRVSRYETHQALPPLRTALAYEAILGKPISELFGGAYEEALLSVRARARELLMQPTEAAGASRHLRRQGSLKHIAA